MTFIHDLCPAEDVSLNKTRNLRRKFQIVKHIQNICNHAFVRKCREFYGNYIVKWHPESYLCFKWFSEKKSLFLLQYIFSLWLYIHLFSWYVDLDAEHLKHTPMISKNKVDLISYSVTNRFLDQFSSWTVIIYCHLSVFPRRYRVLGKHIN